MSIRRHTAYNVIGSLAPLAVALITVPIYLKIIGIERYGVLALCWTLLGFMGFLNLGMGPAITQRLAALRDAAPAERARVFWTALWLNLAMSAVGGLLAWLGAEAYFNHAAAGTSSLSAEIDDAIPWLALVVPVAILSSLMNGALQGRERFLSLNAINAGGSVAMALLPLAAAYLIDGKLDTLVAAGLVAKLGELILLFWMCAKAIPLDRPARLELSLVGGLLSYGGWITVSSVLVPILATVDRFVLGALIGPAAVAVYSIPYNLVSRISILPWSLARALLPRFAATDAAEARALELQGARAIVAVMTPLAVLLITIFGPFLELWLGQALARQSAPVAYILVGGFWINAVAYPPYVLLQGRGRPDVPAKLHIAYLIPYCALLYFCVLKFGVLGAAIAWSVRSFWDPALYLFTGSFRTVFPIVLCGAAIVAMSMGVSLAVDWRDPLHWLLLAAILALSFVLALFTAPFETRKRAFLLLRKTTSVLEGNPEVRSK